MLKQALCTTFLILEKPSIKLRQRQPRLATDGPGPKNQSYHERIVEKRGAKQCKDRPRLKVNIEILGLAGGVCAIFGMTYTDHHVSRSCTAEILETLLQLQLATDNE